MNARRWLRPTLEVVGIYGGFSGVGIKTIVPSKATAKISCRLVPDQDPDHVMSALKRHVDTHAPAQTRLTFTPLPFRAHPYIMPRDTVANRAAAKVTATLEFPVYRKTPLPTEQSLLCFPCRTEVSKSVSYCQRSSEQQRS